MNVLLADITWRPDPSTAAPPRQIPWTRWLLVAGRIALACLVGLWLLGVALVVAVFPAGPVRSHLAARGIRHFCRLVLRALGVRVTAHGMEAVPTGSLLVANHLSWLDVLVMLSSVPCTFVGKREILEWPFIGPLAEALGVIWIDRTRARDLVRVIPAMRDAMATGRSVMLFPEGTTTDGRRLLPFKSGLFQSVVGTTHPVIPCALTPSVRAGDVDALCWYGDENLLANIPRVAALSGATLQLRPLDAVSLCTNRKVMARAAHASLGRVLDVSDSLY